MAVPNGNWSTRSTSGAVIDTHNIGDETGLLEFGDRALQSVVYAEVDHGLAGLLGSAFTSTARPFGVALVLVVRILFVVVPVRRVSPSVVLFTGRFPRPSASR